MAEFNPIKDDNLIALTRLFFEKMASESENKLVFCISLEKAIINQFPKRKKDYKELENIEEFTTDRLNLSLAMCERAVARYKMGSFNKTLTLNNRTRHYKTMVRDLNIAVGRMMDIMITCVIEENIKMPQDIFLAGVEPQTMPKL